MTYDEEEQVRNTIIDLLRKSDIEFNECSMILFGLDYDADRPVERIEVNFIGPMTFALLEQLSQLFATRKIDLDCEHGTGSDPCHERIITIWPGLRFGPTTTALKEV